MESTKKISRGRIQRKTRCMGPYAGVYYNLTLCPLKIWLQHIYHGLPYARVDINPMPESILFPSQWLWFGLRFDFGIGGEGCGVGGGCHLVYTVLYVMTICSRKKIRSPGPILNDLDWSFFPTKETGEKKHCYTVYSPPHSLFLLPRVYCTSLLYSLFAGGSWLC
jgi:hypothetical protein